MAVLLAVSPLVVILLLMIVARRSADVAGALGWIYTAFAAALFFGTSWDVVLVASLAGIVASLPISLMVAASIFQINIMEEAGALSRLVVFIKTLSRDNRAVQIMLINVGFGTLLAALGATPVSILPPIMLSLGYSAFVAVALPAIGYDALCTYALLGVPIVVFSDVVSGISGRQISPADVGLYFAQFMPVVTSLIALSMLWLADGWKGVRKGWPVALLTGLAAGLIAIAMNFAGLPTLTGVVAGIGVVAAMMLYLRFTGSKIIDRSGLSADDHAVERGMGLGRAALPWLLLVLFSILTNFKALGLFDVLFNRWSMPLEIIPGGKPLSLRMAWHAYTWVLVATVLALPFYRMTRQRFGAAMKKTLRRVPRPAFAAAIFFSIAYILNHSGKITALGGGWVMAPEGRNMVKVVADACAAGFGQAYTGVSALLGLLGGFVSGSETSSIVMLTKLHFDTVHLLFPGMAGDRLLRISLLVAAVSGIGGGLASVISPAKLQNAAAVIDRIGLESQVIRKTAVIAILMVLVTSLLGFIFLAFI